MLIDASDILASLAARRAELRAALAQAEAHVNAIRGGIAEIDYLIETGLPFHVTPALQEELKMWPPAAESEKEALLRDRLQAARQHHEAPRD